MIWTIPNVITIFRVLLIPVFVSVYFLDWKWGVLVGSFVFLLAAVTDWVDGYLARKLEQSSPFGAFLDPVADKLIVAAALLMITHQYASAWITIPAIILLMREVYISALRQWMSELGASDLVQVSFIGKAKTLIQMIALVGLLAAPGLKDFSAFIVYWESLGRILLYVAAWLSLWSMAVYTIPAWKTLLAQKQS